MRSHQVLTAPLAAILAGATLAGCTTGEAATADRGHAPSGTQVTVNATATGCMLSAGESTAGTTTFVVENNGTEVTEFYVYGKNNQVLGEVENVAPGAQRQLVVAFNEAGAYQVACKHGIVGDGVRSGFNVTGEFSGRDTEAYKTASADYKAYVVGQADALFSAATLFVAAIKSGDIAAAKARYPASRIPWERIEPVAEAFPDDLDPRIDLREADLQDGQKWTGFHRLEKDLWVSGPQPDTNAVADQLLADITELRDKVRAPAFQVDATQIAAGAQGLLDEVASSKITGEEDVFSHTDLWDFQANVEGSAAAVAAVRPILDDRNAGIGKRVDQRFADIGRLLDRYRDGEGFISYTTVTEPQRQELSRAIDALGKEVSQVQGVIAPE